MERKQEIEELEKKLAKEKIRLAALKEQDRIEKLIEGMENPSIIISSLHDDPSFTRKDVRQVSIRQVSIIRGDCSITAKPDFIWVDFDSLIYFMKQNPDVPVFLERQF